MVANDSRAPAHPEHCSRTPDRLTPVHVVVLAGGVGGSKFARGVLAAFPGATITVVGNTADDLTLHGMRICPDLDTMMYGLGGGLSPDRGWGRDAETFTVLEELRAHGVEPLWFGLGDKDLATHLIRTQLLNAGATLTEVTAALGRRWLPDRVRLLPMSDDRIETHVVIDDADSASGRRTVHFQEYWVRLRARPTARATVQVGGDDASPAPGVVEAIAGADLVLLAPSNPVVSIGPILGVPRIREAVTATDAPVVGFSGIIGGHPLLGMADKLLPTIGVDCTAGAVGRHYGPRSAGGVLDGWVVHHDDVAEVDAVVAAGLACWTDDLIMVDPAATARFVTAAADRMGVSA